MKAKTLLIGAHQSIAGGLHKALYSGAQIGCTCIQIFTHSNRQWHIKDIPPVAIHLFEEAREKTGIKHIVVHSSYLVNPGSADQVLRARSIATLQQELKQCEQLSIPVLILHPGAAVHSSEEECIQLIAQSLEELCETSQPTTTIALENGAGQGTTVGHSIEQLARIKHAVAPRFQNRISFCIDTCHAFAAGYDIHTPEGYTSFWKTCDSLLGLKHISAIHLNDSKKKRGSRIDRHEHIGQGELGSNFFKMILHDTRLAHIPKILETPVDGSGNFETNMNMLRSLAE